ncbi:MaoC family dehydratase [Yinghuangia sp. YIM S09857]|uniref:MaoC family dehydratase n=1 Tax=Yinghuangia sp. YIM S09857 TaxID=3436929 RepID=UPI003F530D6C
MRAFANLHELALAKGQILGTSDWVTVTQERIDRFADATGDHQWIHVDAERAEDGPFGGTIAHGYLTLALLPSFAAEIFRVDGLSMAVNYGVNKVRFPAPVPSGSRVRSTAELLDVLDAERGKIAVVRQVVEADGVTKPVCVAECLALYVP